ncbi:hypothetical protein [Companilactobacillus hulinensis]|uniref:hypothetical protein n=1 Tax=Companilactobacillus hulinensis TaxID=2486007 RepID=UPI0013DE6A48|nr:hypothetical protein [Companilactobacillus hulinensis]
MKSKAYDQPDAESILKKKMEKQKASLELNETLRLVPVKKLNTKKEIADFFKNN